MAASVVAQPLVEWAQRKDVVFMTIGVEDSKKPEISLTDDKFHFRGRGGPDQREYECTVEFFKEVDASKARRITSDRSIQYVMPKKEPGPFWPRLLKSDKKVHWVKIDFNKWKDEDELSDDEGGLGGGQQQMNLNDMMGQMGGFGGGRPDLEDLEDSDNEELPDLEDDKEEEGEGDHKEEKKESAAAAEPSVSSS